MYPLFHILCGIIQSKQNGLWLIIKSVCSSANRCKHQPFLHFKYKLSYGFTKAKCKLKVSHSLLFFTLCYGRLWDGSNHFQSLWCYTGLVSRYQVLSLVPNNSLQS